MTVSRRLLPLQHGSRCPDPAEMPHFSSDPVRRCAAPAVPSWPVESASPEQDSTAWGKGTQPEKSPTTESLRNKMQDNVRFFSSLGVLLAFKNNQKLCMNYVQHLHKHHMENDGTFSCLWGKLLCFWKYSVWLAVTKCSEDSGNTNHCVCACFRVQEQLQVPLVASASLNMCNLLTKIPNELKKPF